MKRYISERHARKAALRTLSVFKGALSGAIFLIEFSAQFALPVADRHSF